MNSIDFNKAEPHVQDQIIEEINNVLITAGTFGGKAVSDYVANVLVPREKDPKCKVAFHRLVILFECSTRMVQFISKMGSQLKYDSDNYFLLKLGFSIATIDLYTSINSIIDVASLTCSFDKDGNKTFGVTQNSNSDIDKLKEKCLNKITVFLRDDGERLTDHMSQSLARLKEVFWIDNWIIELPKTGIKLSGSLTVAEMHNEIEVALREKVKCGLTAVETNKMLEDIDAMMKTLTEMKVKLTRK